MTIKKLVSLFAIGFILVLGAVIAGNFVYDHITFQDPAAEVRVEFTDEATPATLAAMAFETQIDVFAHTNDLSVEDMALFGGALALAMPCNTDEPNSCIYDGEWWGPHYPVIPYVTEVRGDQPDESYKIIPLEVSRVESGTKYRPRLVVYHFSSSGTVTKVSEGKVLKNHCGGNHNCGWFESREDPDYGHQIRHNALAALNRT